jgi:serine/threonine protein kinase
MSFHQLYRRVQLAGKGAYGAVYKGVHIPTGNVYGLKVCNLDVEGGIEDAADIQREVALLTSMRDAPNVTQYFGCYMDGPRVWIVMEWAEGGSVRTLAKPTEGMLEEKYIVVIIREVLIGLAYLHKSNIIHRDIKGANILVAQTGKVMICDFGVSALLATSSSKRTTFIGTPYWMAPEVAMDSGSYDSKADIWSLGILIWEMLKGVPPHSNIDFAKVLQLITRAKAPRLAEGDASKDMRDFVTCCLQEVAAEVRRLDFDFESDPFLIGDSVCQLKSSLSTSGSSNLREHQWVCSRNSFSATRNG